MHENFQTVSEGTFSEAGRAANLRPMVLEGASRETIAGEHSCVGLHLRGHVLDRCLRDLPGVAREARLKLEEL